MQMQMLDLADVSSPDNILINRLPCLETQGMVVKYEFGWVCLRFMAPCEFASQCWFDWCSLVCLVVVGRGRNQSGSQNIHKIPKLHYSFCLQSGIFKLKQPFKAWISNAWIPSAVWLSRNTRHHSANSCLFSHFISLSHLNQPSAVMWSVQSCELVVMAIFTQQQYNVFIALLAFKCDSKNPLKDSWSDVSFLMTNISADVQSVEISYFA